MEIYFRIILLHLHRSNALNALGHHYTQTKGLNIHENYLRKAKKKP